MTDKRAELGRPKSIQPTGGYTLATTNNRIDETAGNADTLSSLSLETLATVANESAEAAMNAAGKALEHAIRCGRALNAAKSQMDHGGWLPWLKRNFDRSVATATRYMRLAENSSRATNLEDAPSIRAALRIIAAEDAEVAGEPFCEVDDDIDGAVDGNVDDDDEAETTPPADTRPARPARVLDDATAPTPTPTQAEPTLRRQRFRDEFRKVLKTGPEGRVKAQRILTECLHSLAAASSREDRNLGRRLVRELIAEWTKEFGLPVAGRDEPAAKA